MANIRQLWAGPRRPLPRVLGGDVPAVWDFVRIAVPAAIRLVRVCVKASPTTHRPLPSRSLRRRETGGLVPQAPSGAEHPDLPG